MYRPARRCVALKYRGRKRHTPAKEKASHGRRLGKGSDDKQPHPSKLTIQRLQLRVAKFSAFSAVFQVKSSGDGGVPFVRIELASVLSGFETVVHLPVLELRRRGAGKVLGFPVGADLAAGFCCFAGRDIVAVAGIVASVQEEETPAVMAAARRVSRNKTPIEIRI